METEERNGQTKKQEEARRSRIRRRSYQKGIENSVCDEDHGGHQEAMCAGTQTQNEHVEQEENDGRKWKNYEDKKRANRETGNNI